MIYYAVAIISTIIVGGSAFLSAVYGATLGGSSTWLAVVFFAVFGALSALTAVLAWFQAKMALMLWRQYSTPALVLFLFLLPVTLAFVAYDTVTNFGTGSLFRENDMKQADNQNTDAKNVRAEVSRIQQAIADIRKQTAWTGVYTAPSGTTYPLTDPKALTEQIKLQRELVADEAKRVRCGPICDQRKLKLRELMAAQANAATRADLMQQMRTYEIELKDSKSRVAETPTVASGAMTHSRNLGAILTGQMNPSAVVKFWANYGITFAAAFACTMASVVTSIILAAMGDARIPSGPPERYYEPAVARPAQIAAGPQFKPQPLTPVDNPTHASSTSSTVTLHYQGDTNKPDPKAIDRLMQQLEQDFGLTRH